MCVISVEWMQTLRRCDDPEGSANGGPEAARESGEVRGVHPPVLFEKTQKILGRLEQELGEPMLTYWNSNKGSICQNDVAGLYGLLQRMGKVDRLSMFIKSDGGSGQASLRMVNLLRQYAKHLTVLVPFECQSAATMLALGADRILMGPIAHLSAVDTSLTHDLSPIDRDNDRVSVSQDELQRVVALWQRQTTTEKANPYESLFKYVHPLVIGAVDRSSALSTKLCLEILSYHMDDLEKATGDQRGAELGVSVAQLSDHAARGAEDRAAHGADGGWDQPLVV